MYIFYDLLNDIMLLGVLALCLCLLCALLLIVMEMPRLLYAAQRKIMHSMTRIASGHGGLRIRFLVDRTTHGQGRA